MADYYSIIKKTIDGLPNNSPEVRNAVYRKARVAIENQLRGMAPPPSDQAIATQLRLLEESISVVDAEYAPTPPAQPDPVPPTPLAVPVTPPSDPAAPPAVEQPAPATSATTTPVSPEPVPATEPPVSPPLQAEGNSEIAPVDAPPSVSAVPAPDNVQRVSAPVVETRAQELASAEKKSGGVSRIITTLIILGVLGGGGYALWANKDELRPLLASVMPSSTDVETADNNEPAKPLSEAEQAIEEDTSAQVEKEAVKLGQNGEDEAVTEQDDQVVRIIEPEPETEPLEELLANEDEASGIEETPVEEVVENTQSEEAAADNGEAAVEEVAPEQTQTLPIGEVAYLYEEGSAGAGASRTNAAVTWAIKRESIADGLPPEAVIVGAMEVPERNLSVDIEIKRNVDDAVSASHLIEMRFGIPEGFSGGGIDNIARFVMKSTEEARGEPLVAVPVKVSDGFFLIALDNLQQAVSVNTQLLTDAAWIDVPVSYSTGKRALITLEKGGTGDQVFRDALRDWENR